MCYLCLDTLTLYFQVLILLTLIDITNMCKHFSYKHGRLFITLTANQHMSYF